MFRPQKVSRGETFLVRFTENTGGLGNSSASIDVNAFHTTNFRSQSAMRGAENHGNTHCDGPTRIHNILRKQVCQFSIMRHLSQTEIGITLQH